MRRLCVTRQEYQVEPLRLTTDIHKRDAKASTPKATKSFVFSDLVGMGSTVIDFNERRIKTIMLSAAIPISVNPFVTEPKGTFHVWLGGKPTHNGGQECSWRIYTTKEKGETFLYASM